MRAEEQIDMHGEFNSRLLQPIETPKNSTYTTTPNRYSELLPAGRLGVLTPVRASCFILASIRTGFWAY